MIDLSVSLDMADGILSPKLLASPVYLENCKPPETPQNLLGHRLLAITRWKPENSWSFANANGKDKETLTFQPYFSMNDYTGLASALLAGAGVGELPPLVQPELPRNGRLVEVVPKWRFRTLNFSVAHLANRYIPRPVRTFKESAPKWRRRCFQRFRLETEHCRKTRGHKPGYMHIGGRLDPLLTNP